MNDNRKRRLFYANKAQASLLYPILIPCLLAVIMLFIGLSVFYYLFSHQNLIFHDNANGYILRDANMMRMQTAVPWFVTSLSLLFVFMSFVTYMVSKRLLGPYERVLREMDEILAGKRKEPIKVRDADEVFKELLIRINVLLEKIR